MTDLHYTGKTKHINYLYIIKHTLIQNEENSGTFDAKTPSTRDQLDRGKTKYRAQFIVYMKGHRVLVNIKTKL